MFNELFPASAVPIVNKPLLTFNVPVYALSVLLVPAVNAPVEYNEPAPVSVPTKVPLVTFRVPSLLMVPPLSVVTAVDIPDPRTRLPSDNVPMVLPVPANVNEPPFIVVKYAVPAVMFTVPALNVANNRFAPLLKFVIPAPLNAPIATEPLAAVKARLPALLTLPRDPASVALVPNVPENVADPPEEIVNPLPPLNSVPTARVPVPTFNVPV
jgi:hypothetical protein